MVEHHLAKVGVAGSNPVFRSIHAGMAELADAPDSKSGSFWSVGSTPTTGIFRLFYVTIRNFD